MLIPKNVRESSDWRVKMLAINLHTPLWICFTILSVKIVSEGGVKNLWNNFCWFWLSVGIEGSILHNPFPVLQGLNFLLQFPIRHKCGRDHPFFLPWWLGRKGTLIWASFTFCWDWMLHFLTYICYIGLRVSYSISNNWHTCERSHPSLSSRGLGSKGTLA